MTKHITKLAGGLAALLALGSIARADIKLNDKFTISGYLTGTAAYFDEDGTTDKTADVDSMKVQGTFNLDKVTGVVSFHSFTSHDPVLLDAYVTYAANDTTTVTMGNFLSYLGFEAFDYPNMLQISYANALGLFIPAYHTGVKVDSTFGDFSVGVAALDSVYGSTYYKGDGDLNNGGGVEGYLKYAKGDSSVFLGFAYDGGTAGTTDDQTTIDLWGQTKAGATTLAAEYCYSTINSAAGSPKGYFWLLLAMQPINDKWTVTARVSGGEDETMSVGSGTPKFLKGTISPAVTLTDNLAFLMEYSYVKYDNYSASKDHYIAAQFVFKF